MSLVLFTQNFENRIVYSCAFSHVNEQSGAQVQSYSSQGVMPVLLSCHYANRSVTQWVTQMLF